VPGPCNTANCTIPIFDGTNFQNAFFDWACMIKLIIIKPILDNGGRVDCTRTSFTNGTNLGPYSCMVNVTMPTLSPLFGPQVGLQNVYSFTRNNFTSLQFHIFGDTLDPLDFYGMGIYSTIGGGVLLRDYLFGNEVILEI
jgi:hypothetical protein